MDKWFLFDLILVFFVSIVAVIARRQGIKEKEQAETNPTADDFEILE